MLMRQTKKDRSKRFNLTRRLRLESLETRHLLAADVMMVGEPIDVVEVTGKSETELCQMGIDLTRGTTRQLNMQDRLNQIINVLDTTTDADAANAAIDLIMAETIANMRILPTGGDPQTVQDTQDADTTISGLEQQAAQALEDFVNNSPVQEAKSRALDLKLLIEEISEVAQAVGNVTQGLADGQQVPEALIPLLDEATGEELLDGSLGQGLGPIAPGFEVKLRGPFVPPAQRDWYEDVIQTGPIGKNECSVVFKETRGLMLKLVFVKMTVVADPWATPLLARGTNIPVFALQLVPSEYVKTFEICNKAGKIDTKVSQRVVQDTALNYFWRYYANS